MPVASPHQGPGFGDEGAPGPVQRRRPSRPATLLLAVALAASLATACSKSDSADGPTAKVTSPKTTSTTTAADAPETTSTTLLATTTTAPPTPEQKVEAAFLAITENYYRRLAKPDPDDPTIRMETTGDFAERTELRNRELQDKGQVLELTGGRLPRIEIRSVSIDQTSAEIVNCVIDDSRVLEPSTESVIDDDVSSRLIRATLRFDQGRWKLAQNELLQAWPDGEGCR